MTWSQMFTLVGSLQKRLESAVFFCLTGAFQRFFFVLDVTCVYAESFPRTSEFVFGFRNLTDGRGVGELNLQRPTGK